MAQIAVWDDVMNAVKAKVLTMGFAAEGIPDAHVVVQTVGDAEAGDGPSIPGYPCLIIFPGGGEVPTGGTNIRDNRMYPVGVALLSQEKGDQTTHRVRNFGWRSTITRTLDGRRLAELPVGPAHKCEVQGGTPGDRPRWMVGEHAQLLIIKVTVLESRL